MSVLWIYARINMTKLSQRSKGLETGESKGTNHYIMMFIFGLVMCMSTNTHRLKM